MRSDACTTEAPSAREPAAASCDANPPPRRSDGTILRQAVKLASGVSLAHAASNGEPMNHYANNSPEAISRVLAMMMITDAKLDERELDIMDELNIYALLGIDRNGFAQVVQDYCEDLLRSGNTQGRVRLVDKERIDEVIACVDDPRKRIYTCGMLLNVANADGKISDSEMAVFLYILEQWGLSLEELEAEFTKH
jgi:hypothetical protein